MELAYSLFTWESCSRDDVIKQYILKNHRFQSPVPKSLAELCTPMHGCSNSSFLFSSKLHPENLKHFSVHSPELYLVNYLPLWFFYACVNGKHKTKYCFHRGPNNFCAKFDAADEIDEF